jgi:hypothetical protein
MYVHGEQLCVRLVARFLVDAGCIGPTDVDPATADLVVTAGDVDPAWCAANPRAILFSLPAYTSADTGMPREREDTLVAASAGLFGRHARPVEHELLPVHDRV